MPNIKKKINNGARKADSVFTSNPAVAERQIGAATTGSTTIVVDTVDVVTSTKDALNIPVVIPKSEADERPGFEAIVTTDKQDRGLDRVPLKVPASYTDVDISVGEVNPYLKQNDASVVTYPTAITAKPLNANEYFRRVKCSTHNNIGGSAVINMLHDTLKATVGTIKTVSDVFIGNISGLTVTVAGNTMNKWEYFIVDIDSDLVLTSDDTSTTNVATDSDAALQSAFTQAAAMLKLLQNVYHCYPGVVEFSTNLGGIAAYQLGSTVIFALPVTHTGTQVFDSSTWRYTYDVYGDFMPSSVDRYSNKYESVFGNKIQQISTATPGLYEYSNANIAFAKMAVKFKEMAIARNDTINPCYQLPLVRLEAMARRNTLLAAHAAIAVRQVSALQKIAAMAKPFWPTWAGTYGSLIEARKEEIDAHLTTIQSNLATVRVKKNIFSELVRTHDISLSPRKSVGQLKVIVPTNACFPITLAVEAILCNTPNGGHGYSNQHNQRFIISDTYNFLNYANVVDWLCQYLRTIALSLKDDSVLLLDSGTACYSLLSDVQYVSRADLKARLFNINSFNIKPYSYRFIKADQVYFDIPHTTAASDPIHISDSVCADGRNVSTYNLDLPSTYHPHSANDDWRPMSGSEFFIDSGYVTGRQLDINGIHTKYDHAAVAPTDVMKIYNRFKTVGNNVDPKYACLSCAGVAVYMQERIGYNAIEFIKYFSSQFVLGQMQSDAFIEPYAAYFNLHYYNSDSSFYGVTEFVPGEYHVVDIPNLKQLKIAALCKEGDSVMSEIKPFAPVHIDVSQYGNAGPDIWFDLEDTKHYNQVRALLSGFGLTMISIIRLVMWRNHSSYPSYTVNSVSLYMANGIDETVIVPDFTLSGFCRGYHAADFTTMKYEFAAHNSLLYLLD